MNQILNIKNLKLGFSGKRNFSLDIPELSFDKGKMYFLLGQSGSGKSTFLEAVALMTNSILNDGNIVHCGINGDRNILDLWSDKEALSRYRLKYLSFIFQSTNLMDNFTVGENIFFNQLLQGISLKAAREQVLPFLHQLKLDENILYSYPKNLSGGQKQRMAFLRGILSSYQIIFCDEPTGNLDPGNSEELMKMLNSEIRLNDALGIVVSHSYSLSVKFADEIIFIQSIDEEHSIIEVNDKLIKKDNKWYYQDTWIENPLLFIINRFNT